MKEELDVFEEVKGPGSSGAFVHLFLVFGLMGVDPLQDTQTPATQTQRR